VQRWPTPVAGFGRIAIEMGHLNESVDANFVPELLEFELSGCQRATLLHVLLRFCARPHED